jgi:hypothetical protein
MPKRKVKYESETDEEGNIKETYEAEAGEPEPTTSSDSEDERYSPSAGN